MYKTISINKQNKIKILDQRKLPFKTRYIITDNYKIVIKAIKNWSVRGAPAIGVAGGFAAFLAINKLRDNVNFKSKIKKMLKEIEESKQRQKVAEQKREAWKNMNLMERMAAEPLTQDQILRNRKRYGVGQ